MKTKFTLSMLFMLMFMAQGLVYAQQFNMKGSAAHLQDECYLLTPASPNSAKGAIWNPNTLNLTEDFEINFSAFFGNTDLGGDGIAFVLQNSSAFDLGGDGSALGYAYKPGLPAITPSVAVEFDTHWDAHDGAHTEDHIAIVEDANQSSPIGNVVSADRFGANIEDDRYHDITILWNAGTTTLSVYFDGYFRTSVTQDFATTPFNTNAVFWGFTAGTSLSTNRQEICVHGKCGRPDFGTNFGIVAGGGTGGEERAFSVKSVSNCEYIVAGRGSFINQDNEMMVASTLEDGSLEWLRTYTMANSVWEEGELRDIEVLDDGYIATGWVRNIFESMFILRLDRNGDVLWSQFHGTANLQEEGWDIEETPDGGFIAVGSTPDRIVLVRLDDQGNIIWSNSYGQVNQVWQGFSVEPTDDDGDGVADDGFVVAGTHQMQIPDEPTINMDWLVLKTNANGAHLWNRTFGSLGVDESFTIKQVDMDGDQILDPDQYLVGGYFSDVLGVNPNLRVAATVLVTNSLPGTPTPADWYYNQGLNAEIRALEQTEEGFILSGFVQEAPGTADRNALLISTDILRNVVWSNGYGVNGQDDWANSVEEIIGAGYVFAGGTLNPTNVDENVYLVKTDMSGATQCAPNAVPSARTAQDVFPVPQTENETEFPGWFFKNVDVVVHFTEQHDCNQVNKKDFSSIDDHSESKAQVFPNPVRSGEFLTVNLSTTDISASRIIVHDVTGRIVYQHSFTREAMGDQITIPTSDWNKGLYNVTIELEGASETYKVVVE